MEMSIMKKIVCLILVLVLCLSLACNVFAAGFASSPSNPSDDCDHVYVDGVCIKCGMLKDNPETGDNSMIAMWIGMMVVAAAGLVTVTVIYRKKFANE